MQVFSGTPSGGLDGLNSLKGTGKNEIGLCGFEKGKEYYESLVRTETGSNRSVDDLLKLLDTLHYLQKINLDQLTLYSSTLEDYTN